MDALTRNYVLSVLRWDGQAFYWLPRHHDATFNQRFAGKRAGTVNRFGYRIIKIANRSYKEHRLVWLVMTGDWPKHQIDHINGNTGDNRFENLRDVPGSINQRNCRIRSNNKSGVMGVSWNKKDRQWVAQARLNGRQIYLGGFSEKQDAIAARLTFQRDHDFTARHGAAA